MNETKKGYDVIIKADVPTYHASRDLEGLGLLDEERVHFNRVLLLRHQSDDPNDWSKISLIEGGVRACRYAVTVTDTPVDNNLSADFPVDEYGDVHEIPNAYWVDICADTRVYGELNYAVIEFTKRVGELTQEIEHSNRVCKKRYRQTGERMPFADEFKRSAYTLP